MNPATLSIIIPTVGRRSLAALLDSIATQEFIDGDEVLVIGDDPQGGRFDPNVRVLVEAHGKHFSYLYLADTPLNTYGHPKRNYALALCKGDYISYQDDDDLMLPGALKAIRQKCDEMPGKMFLFQLKWSDGSLTPLGPEPSQTGGQSFVWPNLPGRMGGFGERYEGDYDFMVSTIGKHPEGKNGLVFVPTVTTLYSGKHREWG